MFRFETGPGNQSFFSIHDQNTAETSQPRAQPTDDCCAVNRACPRGLKRSLEKFDSARLSRKKKKQANFVNRRKLLLKGYNFKEKANTTNLERDLQRTRLRRSTNDRRERLPQVDRAVFFFYDRLRTLDMLFLL